MKKPNVFYIACRSVDGVIPVKIFTNEQAKKHFINLKKKVALSTDSVLSINSYMLLLCRIFIYNSDVIVKNLLTMAQKEGGLPLYRSVLEGLYEAILEKYPPFRLEVICFDINEDILNSLFPGRKDEVPSLIEDFSGLLNNQNMEKGKPSRRFKLHSREDITRLERYLLQRIVGQNEAISEVMAAMKMIASGLSKRTTFCFLGPTGVGKTQLAKLIGKKFSGNFFRVDCGEYSLGHEYAKLIGAPPGYIGHSEKSILGDKAAKSNKWVLLFDEIEKAHPKLNDFLLALMDEGYVTDNLGNTLDFSESILIFTSNQGISDLRLGDRLGFGHNEITYSNSRENIEKSMKDSFKKEFLNRIDNTIYFNPLSKTDVIKIASMELKDYPIVKSNELLQFIVDQSYSEEYGARNIARFIKRSIGPVIADALLDKKVPDTSGASSLYSYIIKDGKIEITNVTDYKGKTDEPNQENQATKRKTGSRTRKVELPIPNSKRS